MRKISHGVCSVIPPHILTRVAEQTEHQAREDARSTLEQMRRLATDRARTFAQSPASPPAALKKRRSVYDARHSTKLPGKLAMSEQKPRSSDVEVAEAYDGAGARTRPWSKPVWFRSPA